MMDVIGVRAALRRSLEARGYDVASDSLGLRKDLYIIGERDLARALFEFKTNAAEACDSMYQGRWMPDMPPRFAVMPSSASDDPELESLEQIGVVPIYFEDGPEGVEFLDLDATLQERLVR